MKNLIMVALLIFGVAVYHFSKKFAEKRPEQTYAIGWILGGQTIIFIQIVLELVGIK